MRLALVATSMAAATFAWNPATGAEPGRSDCWGVRVMGQGAARHIETLSDINIGKPERVKPVDARIIATRGSGSLSLQVLADGATAALLQASPSPYAPELDKALAWLSRLRPSTQPPARIVLTLVDPTLHTRVRRLHRDSEGVVMDLLVPLSPAATSHSAAVGKALAIALHEASHAFAAAATGRNALSRRDDEYRASLVESCYLVDTMRVGDSLQLRPRQSADAGEYFVAAQSRDAARDVVRDLVRAAGTGDVRWNDNTALLGLKLVCAIRLAQA